MIEDGREAMRSQEAANSRLVFPEMNGTIGGGKCESEVQMETGVDRMFTRQKRRAFRIFHEDHGAHRRHRAGPNAIQRIVCGCEITAPIVGVDNHGGSGRSIAIGRRGVAIAARLNVNAFGFHGAHNFSEHGR